MAENTILRTVEQFQKEFELAQDIFNRDGRALENRANRTTMSLNEMNVAFDMIHEGARITAEFFASCGVIVLSLDEICRPLLAQNPGIKAVKAVVDLIEKVNDAVTETNTNFTVSLNGSAKSDVGTMQPVASMEALVIQKFWESYYRRMPEYADVQKEEAAKQAEVKAAAQSQEEMIRAQEQKNEIIRAEAEKLTSTYRDQVELFHTQLNDQIAKNTKLRKKEIAEEKKKLKSTLADTQIALENLGFFKFGEKKALREQIESLEIQIARTSAPQYGMDIIEKQKQAAKEAVSEYRKQVEKFCDKFLTVKTETITIPRAEPLPSRKTCSREEKMILDVMIDGVSYGASDLGILAGFPNERNAFPIVHELVSKGYLEKQTIKGRNEYSLAGKEKCVSCEIVKLNMTQMTKTCPQPPSVESVLN